MDEIFLSDMLSTAGGGSVAFSAGGGGFLVVRNAAAIVNANWLYKSYNSFPGLFF